ncbi:Golgi mannosyltransferase complex subunit [Mortierella sp. AD094]|nr:Golgi mannosyltransferase complex subunit [Mortierella sp. AD094]
MDATSYIDNYFVRLSKLDYPKELISLAFLVSTTTKDGQQDPTVLALESHISSLLNKPLYRRITLIRQASKPFNYTHDGRHEYEVQIPRRKELAYCRNALLSSAMIDESWVLWLDVDVIAYSPHLLVDLMKLDKDVVVPNCFRTETDWPTSKNVPYDRNNWLETTESLANQRVMENDEILFEGYGQYQPTYRQSMADLDPNIRKLVALDGVGGTFTLVKAIVHRSGVNFPIHPVDHQIETEGFAKWAKLLGFSVYGAPHLNQPMSPKAKKQKIVRSTTASFTATVVSSTTAAAPVSAIAARRQQLIQASNNASTPEVEEHIQVDNVDDEEKVSLDSSTSNDSESGSDSNHDEDETEIEVKSNSKGLPTVPQQERRDRKLFVDPQSVSSFKPTRYNVVYLPGIGSPGLMLVGMKRGEVSLDKYVHYDQMFGWSRTHALAVIESVSLAASQRDKMVPQPAKAASSDLITQLKLLLTQMSVTDFDTVIAIQSASDCGISGIEKVVPIFKGILSIKQTARPRGTEDEEKQAQIRFETYLSGFHPILDPTDSIAALKIPDTWRDAMHALIDSTADENGGRVKRPPVSVVCGGKKMGKSTFSRLILNRMLNSTPRDDPDYYMACIKELVKTYYSEVSHTRSWEDAADDYHSDDEEDDHIPLIINTQGWIKGIGYDLLLQLLDYTAPSHIFGFHSASVGDSNLPRSFFSALDEQSAMARRPKPTFYYVSAVALGDDSNLSPFTKYHPADHRALSLLSYFYLKQEHNSGVGSGNSDNLTWDFTQALVVRRPWCWNWSQAKGIWVLFDQVPPSQILHVLNGSLVALTGDKEDQLDDNISDVRPGGNKHPAQIVEPPGGQITPPNYFPLGLYPPPPPEHTTCHGLAIIRSIQPSTQSLHILTPIPISKLKKCNGIVKGAVHMPLHANLDHNEDNSTVPGVTGVPWKNVPYLNYETPSGNYGSQSPAAGNQSPRLGFAPPVKIMGSDAKVTPLEQDFSYNPRIRGKDNADSQCINAETNERNETLKTRQQGLGHAFLVLFQANRSALKRAINDIYGENTLSSAVRSLITHVETIGEKNQDETSLPQIQQVYRPLLDKVLKRSDEPGKRIAFILLDWLILDYPYKSLVALALSSDLGPAIDKKRKLSVLLAIEHALHSANARKSKSEGNRAPSRQVLDQADVQTLGTDAAESEAYPGAQILLQWTLLLSQIIRFDGAAGAGSSRSMTRLTSLAFDVSIEISKVLADQTLRDMKLAVATHELRLVVELNSHEEADAVTRVTYGWCFTQSMLAMDVILQEYQASWSVISSALGQRNSTSSSHLMLEKSEGYLQMIAEDIPVGRNVAHAVQDIYVTFASKLDLEHLKPQVFSALDNATEISVESAELVSQYIMAFQTSLLPELLKLLPDCNHQILWESCDGLAFARTKNALCVVEALAEKDFFSIPLSKEDNDTRLGSELMSDNARSCSNSEATMIECMLSQRSDGSLGDGFISFVEYLRSHQRFSLRIAGTKLKSPAQLVLNVKKMASGSLDQDSDGIMTERLLHVLKLLGDAIPGNLWSGIIDRLALKTYGSPSDQLLIRVWNMLALAIANIPEAIEAVSASILHIMEHQGALTEEILEEALESCDEAIDDLRFARPVGEGNESELISYQMLQALKSRSDNQMEFSLVRTLSKAVMQGMFPESSLEIIFTGLTKSCNYEQDLYKLQLGVVDVFSKVLLATSPFYCHTPNTQFTAKLKRLSRNVSCLTTANTTEATIEEPAYGESVETRGSGDMSQTPKSPEDLFMAILSDILDAITSPVFEYKEANIGIALCLVNVFIMSLQGLAPTPNSKVSKSSTKDLEGISISRSLIASTLMDLLTPLVSACIITFLNNMETLNSKGYTLLTQGCIQILYTGASISATMDGHTISRATKQQMMGVTVMGINCSDPAIAVASLKLLAMMSGSRMMTTELLTDGNLAAIRKGLIQLRHSNGSQFGSPASVTLLLDKMWEIVA